jgi:sulfite reductase beta subunit-like hemoprotein
MICGVSRLTPAPGAPVATTPVPRAALDRCPGVLALHPAQDGGLARVRLPGGRLTPAQLRALAVAAERGSGIVELTARANVQLRGLDERDIPEIAASFAACGLLPSGLHERARNLLASPLGGRHPSAHCAIDDVVEELDRAVLAEPGLAALPGRFLFAVDDGSGTAAWSQADVALVAERPGGPRLSDRRLRLVLAGTPTGLCAGTARAVAAAVEAACAFLALREDAWRLTEVADGVAALAGAVGAPLRPGFALRTAPTGTEPGVLEQRGRDLAITGLAPLGRLGGDALLALAGLADAHGGTARISASRTVSLLDVPPRQAHDVLDALAGAGLVVTPGSGWSGLSACAGLGACAKARIDVRRAAAIRAAVRGPGARPEHWAACERRCGASGERSVTVCAEADGIVVEQDGHAAAVASVADALAVLDGPR